MTTGTPPPARPTPTQGERSPRGPSSRAASPGYAELHCRSNFTFLTGASHPAELIERAAALGYAAIAITDECSLSGIVRAHVAARDAGIQLVVGSEIRLSETPVSRRIGDIGALGDADDVDAPWVDEETGAARPPLESGTPNDAGPRRLEPDTRADDAGSRPSRPAATAGSPLGSVPPGQARLVLLARSRRGYALLSEWITLARRRAEKGSYLAYADDLEGKAPIAPALAGMADCFVLLVPEPGDSFATVYARALWLQRWFQDRARLALGLTSRPGEDELMHAVRSVARLTGVPIVATGDVLMHLRSRKPLQDVLAATRLKRPIASCGRALRSNAEQHLRSRRRLARLYEPEWLQATLDIAEACRFSLAELEYQYPREVVPAGTTPIAHLRELAREGLARRFPDKQVMHWLFRIEKELALIEELRYEAYFLTVADIVRWAREQRILCQGRGSAANSIVCYCLGVTEVNPEEATLLFERFVSAERQEPPDIDVDFEHQRREEVIRYIYAKYGRHRTALTAVVICYRPRSALRDVGRALGMDLQRIESLTKALHWFDGRAIGEDRLREAGIDPEALLTRLWIDLTQQLIGFPRHLSQHPGGFVIARDRIENLVPVETAAMEGRSVVQWDKDDLDELKLIKVDVLALGMLSALRRSLDFVAEKLGRPFRMQDIAPGDAPTYEMICQADTVGTFQIESRAQMSMLPRLQPRCYYDLVVEVAIVRPGPIQGGMVHPYLRNRWLADDEIDCPEELKPALMRTKGVPIFQEQVMQIAMLAADFSPGEADALRRSMAAWKRRGGLGHHHDRLVGRMVEKGYDRAFAEGIFKQIEGFGEYGFPESHAAGFAQLAYFSCWLKRHHPEAFLAGLLNSQPMGFYAPAQLVRDARAHGVEVRPVDVTLSRVESCLEPIARPPDAASICPAAIEPGLWPVRLGFDRVAGLSRAAAERIVAAREEAHFESAEDLARRAEVNAHDLLALAQADALAPLTGHRHQAAWSVAGIDTRPTPMLRRTRSVEAQVDLPAPGEAEETLADYRALGLTLDRHPLALLRQQLTPFRVQPAAVLRTYPDGRLARASGLVTHRQRPETAKGAMFITLEDDTGTVNAIVWAKVLEQQRRPLLAARLLTLFGRWQRQEMPAQGGGAGSAVMHLVVVKAIDHSDLLGGLASRSRDFR